MEEAELFYHDGTPEVPFQSNQEWYATFTGEDGSATPLRWRTRTPLP